MSLSKEIKIQLYITQLMLTYNYIRSRNIEIEKNGRKETGCFEGKFLRKIFDPVNGEETSEQRFRKNKELEKLFQTSNI